MDSKFGCGHDQTSVQFRKMKGRSCDICLLSNNVEYYCKECREDMCKKCSKLRLEVSHVFHPQHPLRRKERVAKGDICDGCNYWSWQYYECKQCEFRLCIECCSSTMSRTPLKWVKNKPVLHYTHNHELSKCIFRGEVPRGSCEICGLRMWGVGYACSACYYFIHESCMDAPQFIRHPFHPSHTLKRMDYMSGEILSHRCNACIEPVKFSGFRCLECEFYLHIQCANSLLRAIKFDCHTHSLVHPKANTSHGLRLSHECPICRGGFRKVRRVFRCAECDLTFHFSCVGIPLTFTHKHHKHTLHLTVLYGIYRDESFSCEICEAWEDRRVSAYGCRQCDFWGHIECVLSKEQGFRQYLSLEEMQVLNPVELPKLYNDHNNKQIRHAYHDHPLSLRNLTNQFCHLCGFGINGQAYKCETCDKEFCMHEKCAKLPEELNHPCHPKHTLFLKKPTFWDESKFFMCNLCRELHRYCFKFSCLTCDFVIDIRCALAIESGQPFDDKGYQKSLTSIAHLHHHELTLANAGRNIEHCGVCRKVLSGLAYCCIKCQFFTHIACLEWPSIIEAHLLHPEHRLLFCGGFDTTGFRPYCRACGDHIKNFGYRCENYRSPNQNCKVAFHLSCGGSLAHLLKQKHHRHRLYYFHEQPFVRRSISSSTCIICHHETKSRYYRCLKCETHFHLECLQLPQTAKHKWHLHWLAFKNSVDYGGHYCDICEEPRDSRYPVYCCEECNFVAHVECIVSKENASKVTFKEIERDDHNIPACKPRKESNVTLEEIESDQDNMPPSSSAS